MTSLHQRLSTFLKDDHLLKRVLKNTGYLFSSNGISLLLSMVQSIFAARLLGAESFGLIAIVMSFVTNINRLFSFRMGEFVVRFLGKELTEKNFEKAGAVVKASAIVEGTTSVLAFLFVLLTAPFGVQFIAHEPPQSVYLFQIFSVVILANLTTETANGVLQMTNKFKIQAGINLVQSILTAAIISAAYFLKGNLLTILWAYLIGKVILGTGPIIAAAIAMHNEVNKDWWKAKISLLTSFKEMAQFAISTNLSGTVKLVASESEPLWIGFFLNKQAVGLYRIAMAIVNTIMMPITPFINTTFPEITRSIVSRSWQQLKQLLKRVTMISASWTVMVAVVLAVFGKWSIGLFYGIEFVPALPILMIILIGFGISNIFFWNRTLLLSFGKANIPLFIMLGAALLKIALGFILVPQYGVNAEAALLSGNLVLSVGLLVVIGLSMINKRERLDIESAAK